MKSWVINKAFTLVPIGNTLPDANVIGSHTVFHRKDDGTVMARIVPWGHREGERDDLQSDSPCLNLDTFRLILSITAENAWPLGQTDIKTAFLQAKGFDRDVFVRPPKEARDLTNLWDLLATAYGLTDSGRLWYRTRDQALVSNYGLTRSIYEPNLYYRRIKDGKPTFILVAQVDNYIYTGEESELRNFESFLQKRFKVGALDRGSYNVMGCEITQSSDHSITLAQQSRMEEIDLPHPISAQHTNDPKSQQPATAAELHAYRSALGRMLYIGRMSHPVMISHASMMATKTNSLQTDHLQLLRFLIQHDKSSAPSLYFRHLSRTTPFILEEFYDASMSPEAEGGGRGACMIVRRSGDMIHPLFWNARKLRRVARSSSTAEILAASDTASWLVYLQTLLNDVTYQPQARLMVDSRALLNLATSVREPSEASNELYLASIREYFTPSIISMIGWTPGHYNVADAFTKDNRMTGALLNKSIREGSLPPHPESLIHTAESEIRPSNTSESPVFFE